MLYLENQLYYFKYAHSVKGETRPKSEAKNTSASNPVLYKWIPTTSLSFKQYSKKTGANLVFCRIANEKPISETVNLHRNNKNQAINTKNRPFNTTKL